MKRIMLKNVNKYCLVSDEDYQTASSLNPYGYRDGQKIYVRVQAQPETQLHRLLLEAQKGEFVSFVDGNPLNCQRENLRKYSSRKAFGINRKKYKKSSSKYKGVSRHSNDLWQMTFATNKLKVSHLYKTEREAARAYDYYARLYFGEMSVLNFPNSPISELPAPHRKVSGKSKYRYVSWSSRLNKWMTTVTHQGKQVYGGIFKKKHEEYAAQSADQIMRIIELPDSYLNFPEVTNYDHLPQYRLGGSTTLNI